MNRNLRTTLGALMLLLTAVLLPFKAAAHIEGLTGTQFNFTAKSAYILGGDGVSIYSWGFANGNGPMQYPGPTLIVEQGAQVTINLTNTLPVPVSIVFPGQPGVIATGDFDGVLTKEANPFNGTASYTFTAAEPGTYLYHSGTRPELQVEMGLVGAIVVRPAGFNHMMPTAYASMDSMYDQEFLFLLTEMDVRIHEKVEFGGVAALNGTNYLTDYFSNYWFINGRNAPDTMAAPGGPFVNQPYNCMPMTHPGDKVLMRVISAGRESHPFHYHGNHARVIARNGRLLSTGGANGADLSHELFTIQSNPGETVDAIWSWTGERMGWDIYGHAESDPPVAGEYAPDHGKAFPVRLPEDQFLTFGAMYGGSPFLGFLAQLPPGEGGMNPNAGYVYMWHSHTEKELTNNDIFPGGMMTMMIVEAPWVPIAH